MDALLEALRRDYLRTRVPPTYVLPCLTPPRSRMLRFLPLNSHRDVRIDRPFFRGLVFCLLAMLVGLAGGADSEEPLSPVIVAAVTESQISNGQRVVGTVEPLRTSTIGSAAGGRVLEFLIHPGDAVTEGQPLARLRTDTLMIELDAAKAELRLYEQLFAELKNGSRTEDIAEAQANMLGAKSAMRMSAVRLRRVESLAASRASSASALDDAREKAESTRHAFSASEALLKRTRLGPRVERIAQADAQVELQKQNVRMINDRLGKFTIRAPFDGYVAVAYTEVGAWISQGDPVAQVIQLNEVEVRAPITVEHAVQLRLGDAIGVEFPELPNQRITGTVDRIVPVADARARTFPVFIRLQNTVRDGTPVLMAGMLARVVLPAGKQQTMPLVPKDALVLNAAERAVFVIDRDRDRDRDRGVEGHGREQTGTARKVQVELGIAVGGRIQVIGDVHAHDLVVVVGNERLRDGVRVTIQGPPVEDESATESVFRSAGRRVADQPTRDSQ